MPKSAGAIRKRRVVRMRAKSVVTNQRKQIQRGAKVKSGAVREGSGVIAVEQVWDRRKTLRENYANIGLNNDVRNQRVTGQLGVESGGLAVWNTGLGAAPGPHSSDGSVQRAGDESVVALPPQSSAPIVAALESAAADIEAHNKTIGPRMTTGERKFVESLLRKHGTGAGAYRAMAKDIKLNRSQDTPGALRRKCERYARVMQVSLNDYA